MAAPILPSSYVEWYALPENDPYDRQYAAMCKDCGLGGRVFEPAELLTAVANNFALNTVFIMLGDDGFSFAFHRVQHFGRRMGKPPTPWDGGNFATFQDVHVMGATTIRVPTNAFDRTGSLYVPSIARMNELLANDPNAQFVGPFHAGDVGVELLETRNAAYVPPIYAPLVLQRRLTPRELWDQLVGAIQLGGHADDCSPLVDWCRVALTLVGQPPVSALAQVLPGTIAIDDILGNDRLDLARRDLPKHFPTTPDESINTMVKLLRHIIQDDEPLRVEKQDAEDDTEQQKPPSHRWAAYHSLLAMCQVKDQEDLPPVWKDMANGSAKDDRAILQYHCSKRARQPQARTAIVPIITPQLAKYLGQLVFATWNEQDLTGGLSLFSVVHESTEWVDLVRRLAGNYNLVMNETGSILEDVLALNDVLKANLPTSLAQIDVIMDVYHVLLEVVLGETHQLVRAYGKFLEIWQWHKSQVGEMIQQNRLNAPRFLYGLQLLFHSWFRGQDFIRIPVGPPNFLEILEHIHYETWHPPELPAACHFAIEADAPCHFAIEDDAASTCSALTLPHVTATLSTSTRTSNSRRRPSVVRNPHPVWELNPYTNFNPNSFLRQHGRAPTNAHGTVMCLSWHKRLRCTHPCPRREDHRIHTASELQALKIYLLQCA